MGWYLALWMLCVLHVACIAMTIEEKERADILDALRELEIEIDDLPRENNIIGVESRAAANANPNSDKGKSGSTTNVQSNKEKVGRIQVPPVNYLGGHGGPIESFIAESEKEYETNNFHSKVAAIRGDPLEKVNKEPLGSQFENFIKNENAKASNNIGKRSTDEEEEHTRVKRHNIADRSKRWLNGWLPYMWDPLTLNPNYTYNRNEIMGRMRALNNLAYWTCVRPVEYNSSVPTMVGFTNFLYQTIGTGCWSYVGRILTNQSISCCTDYSCVHEMVHALGEYHEQQNPLHDDFIRVNYDSISLADQSNYFETDPLSAITYNYVDVSSLMTYDTWMFQLNYEPTMSFYANSDLQLLRQDVTGFLMFKEVSDFQNCQIDHCPHLAGKCAVNGYVTQLRNICTCRCVAGLDGATGCTTRYQKDMTSLQLWPTGPVTLLKSKWGCPENWEEGQVTLKITTPAHSFQDGADIEVGADYVKLKFCTKPEPVNPARTSELAWPKGRYCIMMKGACPSGFVEAYLEVTNTVIPPAPTGIYPSGTYNQTKTNIKHCCRNDGAYATPMDLPNKEPFIMMDQGSYGCQTVIGMKGRQLFWTTYSLAVSGTVPKPRVNQKTSTSGYYYEIVYCIFVPDYQDETKPASLWPSIPVRMPKPMEGCPAGYQEYFSSYSGTATVVSTPGDILIKQGSLLTTYNESYCIKNVTSGSLGKFEQGRYCIEKVAGVDCDNENTTFGGFREGTVVIGQLNKVFCCRDDGFIYNPIKLTTANSFVLFQQSSDGCQEVIDMQVYQETFTLSLPSTAAITKVGSPPYVVTQTVGSNKQYTLYMCHYTRFNQLYTNCGDFISLTGSNPSAVIQSPNYPAEYPEKLRCNWNIVSPEGTRVRIQFVENFSIEQIGGGTCVSTICIANRVIGQPCIKYCGDAFPQTTVSLNNFTGIELRTATKAPPAGSVGFKALVTYIEDDWLAYTDRGQDYRGTINITRDYRPCLYWADPKLKQNNCPDTMYSPKVFDEGLRKNYCRNPGHGTDPWCYVEADGCIREYCDVSNLDACYDTFMDCNIRIQEYQALGKNYCDDIANEAPRGCAKTCRKCRKPRFTKISSVTCSVPPTLPEAQPVVTLKTTYKVGETVPYKCINSYEYTVSKCLPDGTWSGQGFVCAKCASGWYAYNGACYKWFDVYFKKDEATRLCAGFNGFVATVKDAATNAFLHSVRGHPRYIWLGLEYNVTAGDHTWADDGSTITSTYNNWNTITYSKNPSYPCAIMHKDQKWRGLSCTASNYYAVMCQNKPRASSNPVCEDSISYCDETLEDFPKSCVDNTDYAAYNCRESCGFCQKVGATPVACSHDESLLVNAHMIQGATAIDIGEIYEYKCNTGYDLTGGNLVRACRKDGKLTGSPPKCSVSSSVPTPNNDISMIERKEIQSFNVILSSPNPQMTLHKDGKIVSWKFYSNYNGLAVFMVLRFVDTNRYQLIGRNVISNTLNKRKRVVDIPIAEQITVKAGDIIGIYLPGSNQGGIAYTRCDDGFTLGIYGGWMTSAVAYSSYTSYTVGAIYQMNAITNSYYICKVYSVTALVQ